jgi:hypothetical protein
MDAENINASNITDGKSPDARSMNHQPSQAVQSPRTVFNMHAPPRVGRFSIPQLEQSKPEVTTEEGRAKRKPEPFPYPDVLESPSKGSNFPTANLVSSDTEVEIDGEPNPAKTRQEETSHEHQKMAKLALTLNLVQAIHRNLPKCQTSHNPPY